MDTLCFRASLVLFIAVLLQGQSQLLDDRAPRYQLQPGDQIEVQYRYTPEYNAVVSVQPDGFVSLPFVGAVGVAGLTLDSASLVIRQNAARRLLDPEVAVLLRDFVKPYFVVAGEVARPGRFELHGNVTVVEAIAQSGGLKESAKYSQVLLVRRIDPGRAQVKLVDMKRLMSAGGIQEDLQLRSGDMLVVPRNFIAKVEPWVRVTSTGLYAALGGVLLGLR